MINWVVDALALALLLLLLLLISHGIGIVSASGLILIKLRELLHTILYHIWKINSEKTLRGFHRVKIFRDWRQEFGVDIIWGIKKR
jgi:hypothetical protein